MRRHFYPFDVPGLMERKMIGARVDDPTIPYRPGRSRRLVSIVASLMRRDQRQSPQAPCSTTSCPATT